MSKAFTIFVAILSVILCSAQLRHAAGENTARPPAYFVDIAARAGLNATVVSGNDTDRTYILESTGTGVAVFDYNNDGWPDIFLVNSLRMGMDPSAPGPPSNHLYRNNHDGTFTDVTDQAGLRTSGWGQGVCVGDYDNDGWEDLYVTYYGKNRLYHNDHGIFHEVAEKAGVAGNGTAWSTGCAFVDSTRRGLLDIAVAHYAKFDLKTAPLPGSGLNCEWKGIAVFCGPLGLKGDTNVLYRNLGNGKFEDVTREAKLDRTFGRYCFSISPLDYDEDGWPDLYFACDTAPSILYHNNHDGTFGDVGIMSGAAYNEDGRQQAGMGSTVADYDGDGHLDIFRTNFSDDTSTLLHNEGDGSFSDVTYRARIGVNTRYLGWGTAFFDFDNDGWPDLILANGHVYPEVEKLKLDIRYQEPRVLYWNRGDGTFADISPNAGPAMSAAASGRGLAIGDLWNDGQQSVVITNMNAAPSLLVNRASNSNHWIEFKTEGTQSNRDGIGARLVLVNGNRHQVDEVRSGSSYISNSDRRVHFGLGPAPNLNYLEISWPSGLRERFRTLQPDSIMIIREGSGEAVPAPAAVK
jgi:enediyne biosynthesis protein E4